MSIRFNNRTGTPAAFYLNLWSMLDPANIQPLNADEKLKVLFSTVDKEQVVLTGKQRHKLFSKIHKAIGTNDYFIVKGTLWELLKHMVANSPDTIEKWHSVRWLLSEIAKFSQEDYGKTIAPK